MLRAFAAGRLFGASYGSGPPQVVALHGWRRTHSDFERVLDGLDAVAVDLPGFGASPPPDTAWGAAEYGAAVVSLLEEIGRPVVLVGHSFGGRVAVNVSATRPDLLIALVLTGVPLLHRADRRARKSPLRFRIARRLNRVGLISDEKMEEYRRRYGSADYRAATGVMRDVLVRTTNESYEEQLRKTAVPVDLVWGEKDDQVPVEVADRAAQMLVDVRLEIVPAVGHLLPTEAPHALRAAIERRVA